MSLAKTLLTAFVALSLAATASAKIRSAANSGTNVPYKTKTAKAALYRMPYLEARTYTMKVTVAKFVPFRQTGLAIAAVQTARVDLNRKVGAGGATVQVAAQAAQIQADTSAVTNATDAQVINEVPNVTQNPLFYAKLQNGVQPRNETSTSTLEDPRRSTNDRQSVSAS